MGLGDIAPGLIVRHTNRRLGKLDPCEASERLISGRISFSEFVDQVGEEYSELLDFMMDNDLHPGRPEEVLFCIDCHAGLYRPQPPTLPARVPLQTQLEARSGPSGLRLSARRLSPACQHAQAKPSLVSNASPF